jgi:uncharacterized membrane protein (DUF2068 family)
LFHQVSLFHAGVLIVNVAVVVYMAFLLITGRANHRFNQP